MGRWGKGGGVGGSEALSYLQAEEGCSDPSNRIASTCSVAPRSRQGFAGFACLCGPRPPLIAPPIGQAVQDLGRPSEMLAHGTHREFPVKASVGGFTITGKPPRLTGRSTPSSNFVVTLMAPPPSCPRQTTRCDRLAGRTRHPLMSFLPWSKAS